MSTKPSDKLPSSGPDMPPEALRDQVRTLQQHLHHLEQQLVSGSVSERQQVATVLAQMMNLFQPLVQSLPTIESLPLRPVSCTPNTRGDRGPDSAFPGRRDTIVRGHLITDVHGAIQLADRAMAQLLHCPLAQLLGERFQDLFADDVSDRLSGYLQKIEQGEPGLEWDMPLSSKHGPDFSALITLTAIRAHDGSIASVHWLIQDVTAHRRVIAADSLLQSLGAQILAGLTFTQLGELICDRLVQTFGYPLVWIGVPNPQGGFEIVSSAGTSVSYLHEIDSRATLEDFQILGQVMTTRNALLISEHPSEWGIWGERVRSSGLEAGLCVPLCSEPADLGVLMVLASTPDAFGPVVVSWFEQLGAQLAVSLFMVKQYEQLRIRDAAIASAGHAVFITDPHGCIEWVNDAYTRLTGVIASELIGHVPSFLQSGAFHLAAQEAHRPNTPGQYWHQELDIQHTDGRSFTVEQIVTPLRDEKGSVTHFVAIHHDITTRKESEAHIYHLAHYDSLTDLPNRVMFHDRLRHALAQARRYDHTVAVMFLDLDRFKSINDGLGHDCGDELLRSVAQRLTRCVRETDTVARLSGDEFAIILQDLERGQDSGHVAQKVLDAVSEPLRMSDLSVATTASIGIALYPVDGTDPDVLLTRADRGMYRAKEKGGDCYQFVSDELNAQAFERLMLEKGLRRALSHSEFVLHYQPEVELRTGQILGMEALIRWHHEELGLVFPSQFMSLAEGLEVMGQIQCWILNSALQQGRAWEAEGLPGGSMLVKYSFEQGTADSIQAEVEQALADTGGSAAHLKVTFSYAQVLRHADVAQQLVRRLSALGVVCILDDVDSDELLGHLINECSFHGLKLSSSLMSGIPADPDAVRTLKSCLSYAGSFDIPIVAKGIESPAQSSFLRELGCHCMQGYLIARPLPVHEMTTALRGWWASEF